MRVVVLTLLAACGHPSRSVPPPQQPIANAQPAPVDPTVTDDWVNACRDALTHAAAVFRREAPRIYPDYRSLAWQVPPEDAAAEVGGRVVKIEVMPGRSWKFSAAAYAPEGSDSIFPDLRAASDTWTRLADFDAAYTRQVGRLTLAILIETERSAVPVAQHPLVVDFVARMKAALDRCVR